MELQGEIERELRKINLSRNRFVYLAQLLIFICSVWFQTEFKNSVWPYSMSLAVLGSFLRFLATEVFDEREKLSYQLIQGGFFILGLAWSLHFYINFEQGYPYGQSLIYLLVAIGGNALICNLNLVAVPRTYLVFIAPQVLTIFWCYIAKGISDNIYVLVNLFFLVLLTSISFLHQHRQLRESIRARLEAERDRNRLRRLMNKVPGFVMMVNREEKYFEVSENVLQLYPDIIGKKIGVIEEVAFTHALRDFLHSDKDTQTIELETMFQGEVRYVICNFARLENGGAVSITNYIDELVKTRRELREKEAVALYSTKLASIGRMAAGVAHEVNNPLAIIQGSANIISTLVQEDQIDRENLKLFAERLVTTSDRIARIVRSLRSLTRGGEQDPFSPLSVKNLIHSCSDLSNHNLRRFDVALILPELKKDMTVLGREVQLGQVLLNLISNSIDAVKNLPQRWIKILCGHQDGEFWIEVTDAGEGIPPDVADKMMEPFFTTKKEEGTGLGLSISRKIMEEHGGKLDYVSGREHTTFRLSFPTPKI